MGAGFYSDGTTLLEWSGEGWYGVRGGGENYVQPLLATNRAEAEIESRRKSLGLRYYAQPPDAAPQGQWRPW